MNYARPEATQHRPTVDSPSTIPEFAAPVDPISFSVSSSGLKSSAIKHSLVLWLNEAFVFLLVFAANNTHLVHLFIACVIQPDMDCRPQFFLSQLREHNRYPAQMRGWATWYHRSEEKRKLLWDLGDLEKGNETTFKERTSIGAPLCELVNAD